MGKTSTHHATTSGGLDRIAADWGFFRTNAMLTEDSDFRRALDAVLRAAQDAGQPYAVIGAVALAVHGYRRFTEDIDLLISPTFAAFLREHGPQYQLDVRGQAVLHIRHRPSGVQIDAVIQGRKPVDDSQYIFPDPADVAVGEDRVADLATLINLKLAVNRTRDFADVVELIKRNPDAKTVRDRVHPSLRDLYGKAVQSADAEQKGG